MATDVPPSLILQPSEFVPLLAEHLMRNAEVKRILPRRRLGYQVGGERFCYLIIRGNGTLHRTRDDRLMGTVAAPALLGLANLYRLETDAYIKTQVPCDIAILRMADVHAIICANHLWEPVAKHMMVVAGKLFSSHEQLTAPSAYQIVRAQLYELLNENPGIRENITAAQYIRDKSHLSRSGIMRILAALKEGGFIELDRGVLKNIIKLPEKF
ncbi:helix-turn-helix domain-containing protein [Citrobacter telavivensis]